MKINRCNVSSLFDEPGNVVQVKEETKTKPEISQTSAPVKPVQPVKPATTTELNAAAGLMLSPGELENFEERAAIAEFDGKLSREEAEACAFYDVLASRKLEKINGLTRDLINSIGAVEIRGLLKNSVKLFGSAPNVPEKQKYVSVESLFD